MSSGDLPERVAKLERENRWMKVGLVVLIGVLVFVGFGPQDDATVEANRFVLRDASGQQRGEWTVSEDDMAVFEHESVDGDQSLTLGQGGILIQQDSTTFANLGGRSLRFQDGTEVPIQLQAARTSRLGEIGPRIQLSTRDHGDAVLGRTRLESERTGSVEVRPTSSLVLFDDSGNVIWRAPR